MQKDSENIEERNRCNFSKEVSRRLTRPVYAIVPFSILLLEID